MSDSPAFFLDSGGPVHYLGGRFFTRQLMASTRVQSSSRLLFLVGLLGLLTWGCEPLTKRAPESSRPAESAATSGNIPSPENIPTPEAPSEPDWAERARYWTEELSRSFRLPEPGAAVTLVLARGGMAQGTFESFTADGVALRVGAGVVTYPLPVLSPASRRMFEAGEYVQPFVEKKVAAEKEEFRRQPSARPAARPAGPPVNARGDGSVWQVKEYVATHVRNPATVQFAKWFPVQKHETGYYVRCHYYADGGSFGRLLEDKVFFMDAQGRVIRTSAGTGSL